MLDDLKGKTTQEKLNDAMNAMANLHEVFFPFQSVPPLRAPCGEQSCVSAHWAPAPCPRAPASRWPLPSFVGPWGSAFRNRLEDPAPPSASSSSAMSTAC
jgi:hypothetical protein